MVNINKRKLMVERANQGLSILELSNKANLTPQTISRIEKGEVIPRLTTVKTIVKALGKELDDFIMD